MKQQQTMVKTQIRLCQYITSQNTVQIILIRWTAYGFIQKNETTHFNADIEKNAAFKSFMCKTKLVAKTEAQTTPDNKYRFLKNAAIPVS